MLTVKKRSGKVTEFNFGKIEKAIRVAFNDPENKIFKQENCDKVVDHLRGWFNSYEGENPIDVESIQDLVERVLMSFGEYNVAKSYILYRERHRETRDSADRNIRFIENYIKSDNTANATIDDNANVANHNIAVLNAEIHKEDNQKTNYRLLENEVRKLYPDFDYKQMLTDFKSIAYLHDSSSQIGMPYCVAVTMYPFLLNGIKSLGGLSAKPESLESFCGIFINMVFAIAAQYKGACLYKDQNLLINGRYQKIKDFVNSFDLNNFFIADGQKWEYSIVPDGYTIAEEGKEALIKKVYRRKYNDSIYKIKSYSGLYAEVSKDHKFKVLRGGDVLEIPAKELKIYDTVLVDKNLSYILDTESFEYKRNFILGMILGDGCLTKENSVSLSINYEQEYYLDIYNKYSKEIFGVILNKNKGHKCWNAAKYNKEYKEKILSFLSGKTTMDKNILPEYLTSINECCGFLDGLMSSDGADRHSFGISLINKGLIESCKTALKKLNIKYTYSEIPEHDNKQRLYTLSFSSCSHCYLPNFCKKIDHEIDRDFYYYASGYAKTYSKRKLDEIFSNKEGGKKSILYNYKCDVITDIETFDNDDDYVYEIETSTHWYNCGGFITHNCATPGFLLCMDWFCRQEWGDDYINHLDDVVSKGKKTRTIKQQILQYFQQITYSINQPASARGGQSVFWNCSIFDKEFFNTMYGEFYFPDGTIPVWNTFNWLQKEYLHWLNQERLKCILTFPVISVALIYKDGKFVDDELYNFACDEYAQGNSFFTYINDSPESLSSCCRLSSKISKPQFNFTNGQIGEMTGSINVITLNFNRITQDWFKTIKNSIDPNYSGGVAGLSVGELLYKDNKIKESYKNYIINVLDRIYKYQTAYKSCLKRLYDAGLLTTYTAGFIDLKKQYLTIGINGLNQAAEFLGYECNKNDLYEKFCNLIFSTIKEQNLAHKTPDLMFNTEFTPCEGAAIKLYNRDKNDGYWVPSDTNLYASYIYKPNDPNISLLDKIYLHGANFCGDYLDGGSAMHGNLDTHLSKEQYEKLLKYAAEVGCKYLTFNIPNSECQDCGFITKVPIKKCPKCGSEHIDYYDRVIGYLTKIKNWSSGRQKEQKTRVYSHIN